jgi:hypothetical protein
MSINLPTNLLRMLTVKVLVYFICKFCNSIIHYHTLSIPRGIFSNLKPLKLNKYQWRRGVFCTKFFEGFYEHYVSTKILRRNISISILRFYMRF